MLQQIADFLAFVIGLLPDFAVVLEAIRVFLLIFM